MTFRVKSIDSPHNALVKQTAKLRTRRGRQDQGRIIIDGLREVSRAINAGVAIEQIFLPQHGGAEQQLKDLEVLTAATGELFRLSARAFSKIAYGGRQEVVGVAATPPVGLGKLRLRDATPCIGVLEGVEKPGNVGAVLRNADAAGIGAVVIVDGRTDLFNPNAIRASLGTIFTQPVASTSFAEFAAWSLDLGLTHLLARVDGSIPYVSADFRQPCAIVLGAESTGLGVQWHSLLHQSIRLPMHGAADSLNVSAAAAVLFFEALRQRTQDQG